MAVLATDNFNRANGGLGANWTTMVGDDLPNISSNAVVDSDMTNNIDAGAYYNATSAPNDQYSKVTGITMTTESVPGTVVRCNTSGAITRYFSFFDTPGGSANFTIYKVVTGTYTSILTGTATIANGDTQQLEVQGTTLNIKRNGTSLNTVGDSAIASGQFGITVVSIANAGTTGVLDDWEGGDFTLAGLPPGLGPQVGLTEPAMQAAQAAMMR